jgi:ABC-type lipoprotein export system ATPase subunit
VLDLLEDLRQRRGLTIILVTHDGAVAARAGRIVRMLDGRVVGEERKPPKPAAIQEPDAAADRST